MEYVVVILILALIAASLSAIFSGLGFWYERKRRSSKIRPETFWKLSPLFSVIFALLAFLYALIA